MSDSRTGQRFRLQLPVRIQRSDSRVSAKAVTENMSAAGVYLSAAVPLKVGAKVKFSITLPGREIGSRRDVAIRCTGRVVRIDSARRRGQRGVACVIDTYRFVRAASGGTSC